MLQKRCNFDLTEAVTEIEKSATSAGKGFFFPFFFLSLSICLNLLPLHCRQKMAHMAVLFHQPSSEIKYASILMFCVPPSFQFVRRHCL